MQKEKRRKIGHKLNYRPIGWLATCDYLVYLEFYQLLAGKQAIKANSVTEASAGANFNFSSPSVMCLQGIRARGGGKRIQPGQR